MARYAIESDYLYVVNDVHLQVFHIQPGIFEEVSKQDIGFGVETIFISDGYLYLGANDGMHIFDLLLPAAPEFLFQYRHITSCDPVVVQGDRAYITLSTGSNCGGQAVNALQIIDISDPFAPVLIKEYPIASPRGLAVNGNLLFVAQADEGVSVFDISDELNISVVDQIQNINAFDVIATSNKLTITGADGIVQYQYQDDNLTLLSKIAVEP
jgi:hypothetical protein